MDPHRPVTLFDGEQFTGKYMLNTGAPGPQILKKVATLMKDATVVAMEKVLGCNGNLLQYGTPDGPPEFVDALAKFLSEEYGESVDRDNLVLSAGATSAFVYLLSQIFPYKTTIWAEELCFFSVINILKSLQFPIKNVKIETTGIDVVDLETQWAAFYSPEEISQAKTEGRYLGVLYLVPHYHNPTGIELTPAKCQKIVEMARKYSILVLCDDIYNILYYSDTVSRRLFAYDSPFDVNYGNGHVISNGTFSKFLSPGLRCGWIEMPKALKEKYWSKSWIMNTSGSVNTYTAAIITELLKAGEVTKMVQQIRDENKKKMTRLLEILEQELPEECRIFHKPTGGYFIYIQLPDTLRSANVVKHLKDEHSLCVFDGQRFYSGNSNDQNPLANGIRISIAYAVLEDIVEAAHLFCKTITLLLSNNNC